MQIPILKNHDRAAQIGYVYAEGDKLMFKITDERSITKQELFEIFGGAGVMIAEHKHHEAGEVVEITAGRLLEFSLCPTASRPL